MLAATPVVLQSNHLRNPHAFENSSSSLETVKQVLQRNHEEHHMFWRPVGGHNHIVHSVLTVYALGGTPTDIKRAFDDGQEIQKPMLPQDLETVKGLGNPEVFKKKMGFLDEYTNFLAYFEKEIDQKGWKEVVQEHLFAKTPNAQIMFAKLFEGLFHPIIHLGLGVEFEQPSIIAEALAQTASHDSMGTEQYLFDSESMAASPQDTTEPLPHLLNHVRAIPGLQNGIKEYKDGVARVREGVLGQFGSKMVSIAARFRVSAEELEIKLAEMVNAAAYTTGCTQRPGKARKMDFFHMHNVTASIFVGVLLEQPWISLEDKIRLLEYKARVDLVWYAASGAVELRIDDIITYKPTASANMDWSSLNRAVCAEHDDGHLAKLIRALKFGEEMSAPFEKDGKLDTFLVKGDMWFKLAQMGYDSTEGRPILEKWVWGVGVDENWANVPALES
jgi:hypothetical protein